MASSRMILKPLVIAFGIALSSCSGGGGGTAATPAPVIPTTVTGTAEAPNGMIAQLEYNQSITVAVTNFVFPPAYAGITGLQPVTGATVELIRIDDDGNQVGDVLASTVTSITGDYSLALPTGVSLAGDLIVRITGNGGASMSAMVVDQAVDINPISQYVLDKFVDDDNLVLGDLALNEVVSLQGKVDEFDLTATSDISSMLAALEAEVGQLVDNTITTIASTPDNGTAAAAAAGKWNIVEFGLGMHDNEAQTGGTFAMDTFGEGLTVAAGATAGSIDITGSSSFIDAWTNYSVDDQNAVDIYHESSVGDSDIDTFPGSIDVDGNITLAFPFEEDLQTVDTQVDLDGPDYGWRWPPATVIVQDTGNNNTKLFLDVSAGVRYETVDTNGDQIKDAIDPAKKDGDEAEVLMSLLLKEGSGITNANVSGDYGVVTVSVDVEKPGKTRSYSSNVGIAGFDGNGAASFATGALDGYSIERNPTALDNITLSGTPDINASVIPFTYSITDKGQLTLSGSVALEGFSNDDGTLAALLNVDTTKTGTPPNEVVTQVEQEMALAVKLSTTGQPDVANAAFKLYPMIYGMNVSGETQLISLKTTSSLTFNAAKDGATADFKVRGFSRGTDVASVTALVAEIDQPTFTVAIGSQGEITMDEVTTIAGDSAEMKGFISADGKMMVLRFKGLEKPTPPGTTIENADLGIIIAIRQ